jgi:enoyl-CoA hydratase
MGTLVSYAQDGPIAEIGIDDGKVNALSPTLLGELGAALDRAEADGAVVVLAGRDGVFSGGFDLGVLAAGGEDAFTMVRTGFETAARLLSFPRPVVVACTGHAIAMGSFLLLSADVRIGAAGATHRFTANEVRIGLTLPDTAIEICRQRIAPQHLGRVTLLSEVYGPEAAVEAGFLDRVVPPGDVRSAARTLAAELAELDMGAHAATKRKVRGATLEALRVAIEREDAAFRGLAAGPAAG